MCNDEIIEAAHSFQFSNNILNGAGTTIPQATIDPDALGNRFKTVSVVNDTDKDIQITYGTSKGYLGSFIVPRSIRGFTKTLRGGDMFDAATIKAISMSGTAAGVTTFNFSS